MKRPRSPSAVPDDPVLAQLDALINGPPSTDAPAAEPASPPPAALPAANPVLAQLDALINPGAAATPLPVHFATPVALVLPPPPLAPPPIVAEPEEPLLPLSSPAWRHAGLLREYGGVHAWMRLLSLERGGEP